MTLLICHIPVEVNEEAAMVMLNRAYRIIVLLLPFLSFLIHHVEAFANVEFNNYQRRSTNVPSWDLEKSAFLDKLVMNMTIPELGMQHAHFVSHSQH